ncbi:WcbI family polysaccharide biosynthesis putative acetyltransferase [Methylobacterium brachiatum]|uniref:WcbI family polysaccharide biosynthesis putative acetyltransferase n=1 Tax=Methylobacterium brachiatum TaxID=269660 RepID=UPI001428C691|nr:WcbI family polysaccharide biosynthesis putative acetyltransferase [Methylobacterium brachiatum]
MSSRSCRGLRRRELRAAWSGLEPYLGPDRAPGRPDHLQPDEALALHHISVVLPNRPAPASAVFCFWAPRPPSPPAFTAQSYGLLSALKIHAAPRAFIQMVIAFFGNCQLGVVAEHISIICEHVGAKYLSNNARTGNFKGELETYKELIDADIIVCQELDANHGRLSISYLKENFYGKQIITVPYIFNSGMTNVGYAPMSAKYSFGEIYGQEEIMHILDREEAASSVISEIEQGNDLGSISRFKQCATELRAREASLDVKVSDFMTERHQDMLLMLTHNHPTNEVFAHVAEQICGILGIGHNSSVLELIRKADNNLPYNGAPYTPQDALRHGYKFGFHQDWKEKIAHLTEMLIYYRRTKNADPWIYDGIRAPSNEM